MAKIKHLWFKQLMNMNRITETKLALRLGYRQRQSVDKFIEDPKKLSYAQIEICLKLFKITKEQFDNFISGKEVMFKRQNIYQRKNTA